MQHLHPVSYEPPSLTWRSLRIEASVWFGQRMAESWVWLNTCVQTVARKRATPVWTIWGVAGALCCAVGGVLLAAAALCLWLLGAALAHGVGLLTRLKAAPETLFALAGALVGCALITAVAFILIAAALEAVWRSTARQHGAP
jgi:hypothetical protein